MAHANDVSIGGWGKTYPNPLVGAVVVRDGDEVGVGWHAQYGAEHAEVAALAEAGASARGATMYVTLEPCTHHGKQPPCVDAIIAAGIARVVVATRDPNPAAGGGVELLRNRGITVDVGVLERDVRRVNFRFLHSFASPARPFVAIKLAVSMDGMIADARGHSRWVSGAAARSWAHWLRAGFGAIAAGASSVMADDARLTVRGAIRPRVAPVRVVFDRSGRLTDGLKLFADGAHGPVIVIVGAAAAVIANASIGNTGAELVVAEDLPIALHQLSARGIDSVLVEGGGRLAGALLSGGLVDRIYQIQCPLWLGAGTPAWAGLGQPAIESAPRWRVTDVASLDAAGDVMIEMEP